MGEKQPEPPERLVSPVASLPRAEDYRSAIGAQNDDSTGKFEISVAPAVEESGALVPLKPGDVFGRYELIRQLGKGGMGSVFLARDTRLGRRVAIKFLHASDATLGRRFIAEARATAQCSHENIVVIHEAAEAEGRHFMVLEYLQGRSLNEVVPSGETASPERAIELLLPVVKALVCAHAAGIVHRDLKPQNVFVTDSGAVKVLDFGIAAILGEESPPEPVDTMSGTLSAMSPEQWNTEAIDHRTDLWSVGIMLFRLLSGAHPLVGKRGLELAITADLSTPMPSLRVAAPNIPPALAAVVDRCLQKAKSQRFQSAAELQKALEPFDGRRVQRGLKLGEAPYAGLASFQEGDSSRFFGRTHEVIALITRLRTQPLVAVVGSSGSGKSSFIRAGVIPALKASGEPWQAVIVRPARRPLEGLIDALLQLGESARELAGDLAAREALLARLRNEPGYAGAALRAYARRTGNKVLVFIDQFEELYTQVSDPDERRLFTTCLSSIADDATSPARVVLSLRADFLDRVAEDPRFMTELSQGLFLMGAPRRAGLREALVEPAEMAGYRFESEEIIDDMLGHLEATQGALPLLQFAASHLWEARDVERRLLTVSSYRAFGGISGALAAHADAVLRELPSPAQQLARVLLPRLVSPERTRALVSLDELKELSPAHAAVEQLVDRLVQARLLVVQTVAGTATVELVHESLIAGWPLLRRWLDEGRDDQAFREQLRTAARQWEARNRAPGLLWSGEALEEARLSRLRHGEELPEKEQAFLDAAFALATRAQRARRAVVMGTITLLAMVVVVGAFALVQVRRAERLAVDQAVLAQREAERAREAEVRASEQLAALQREQAAKARAEAEVVRGKDDLREVNRRLEQALEKARVESATATTLAGSLQTANEKLSRLLGEERARADRLEKERKKITTELR